MLDEATGDAALEIADSVTVDDQVDMVDQVIVKESSVSSCSISMDTCSESSTASNMNIDFTDELELVAAILIYLKCAYVISKQALNAVILIMKVSRDCIIMLLTYYMYYCSHKILSLMK